MKKNIYISITMIMSLFIFSCSDLDDDLEKLNVDKKKPVTVQGGPLFTHAVKSYFDYFLQTNVNHNVFRFYAQYWAATTYPDETNYNQVSRNIPENIWDEVYLDVLKDLKGSKDKISSTEILFEEETFVKNNSLAMITIMEVLAFSTLVDIYGNVPFTEALDEENVTPAYDDAATIYTTIMSNLDNAISSINVNYAGMPDSDPVYDGNMTDWKRFANSLKLRLALRLADVSPATSKSAAEAAASNVISSSDKVFSVDYETSAPNTHPLWTDLVQSGRNDYIPANTMVDVMNDLEDPRRSIYFKFNDTTIYIGGVYGAANSASKFSALGDILKKPDLEGILMSLAEVEFLLAEANERGYNVGGTAESHYVAGIKASMAEWGVADSLVDDYLARNDVAYSTATGTWKEKIGKQKWLALYNLPFEGWTAWRLLDFGILQAPEGLQLSDIPVRFLYPLVEAQKNAANNSAASTAIGGNLKSTKLFWDMN